MKKRNYPNNPDCPLTDKEKIRLDEILDSLEWEAYAPLRHLTSAWATATVTEYDEFEIEIEIESGVDSQGSNYSDSTTIDRANLLKNK